MNYELRTKNMHLLVGKDFYFYGIFQNMFKLDDLVFEALEDPDDGYRSSLDTILVRKTSHKFLRKPLAKVTLTCEDNGMHYIFNLVDENNHIWLSIGTVHNDAYYPYFVFEYYPDKDQRDFVEVPNDYKPFVERFPELYIQAPEWFDDKTGYEGTDGY